MAIRLTREALEYYILTCLSIQDMYGAEILKSANTNVDISSPSFYQILNSLQQEGKIAKRATVQNGVACHLCSITPLGQFYLDAFLKSQ